MGTGSDIRRFLLNWILYIVMMIVCLVCCGVAGISNENIFSVNNTVQGFYNSRSNPVPMKPPKKRDTVQETQRALFLICGVILGVPLGVLAACGVREFVCAMYEKYRLEALRRNYLYRMKIPTTVPVR